MKLWVQKSQPKNLNEVIGQSSAVTTAYTFWKLFNRAPKKALLLYGPPGCGKTSLVYALANQANLEIVEINASDFRNKEHVKQILDPATKQASIFGASKIILIDEVDGMSGQKDRGGVGAVVDVIKETKFPIFITANDPWSDKFKTLRNHCQSIAMNKLSSQMVIEQLTRICKSEDVVFDEIAVRKLAATVDGDLRAAINDLQSLGADGNISDEDLYLWDRERDEVITDAMRFIFKSFDSKKALAVSYDIKEDINSLNLWLEQSIPWEYDIKSIPAAIESVSMSDVFLKRIRRRQHWRFLNYARVLSVVGVQQAKKESNRDVVMYKKPKLIIRLWQRAAKKKKAQGIAAQLEGKLHCSAHVLQRDFLPYLNFIEQHNKRMYNKITTSLGI